MVTDGEIALPNDDVVQRLAHAREEMGLEVHGLLVGRDDGGSPAMQVVNMISNLRSTYCQRISWLGCVSDRIPLANLESLVFLTRHTLLCFPLCRPSARTCTSSSPRASSAAATPTTDPAVLSRVS